MRIGFIKYGILTGIAILAAACDEQQVLYTVKSPEKIDPPPTEGIRPPMRADAADAVSTASLLPAPEQIEFRTATAPEPMRTVVLKGVEVQFPVRFLEATTSSAMRIAEFAVPPRSGSGPDAELVVFHFGANQGGSVADNATRWLRQFRPEEGKGTPLLRFVQGPVGALRVSRISLEGTYAATAMTPNAPPMPPQPGWGLDALILEGGPEGPLFVRLTGPAEMLRAEADVLDFAAASVRLAPGREAAAAPAEEDHSGHDHEGHDHASPPDDAEAKARVELPGVTFEIPAEWKPVETTSSMRALQFELPGPAGPGEFVVFYFGVQGGGGAEDNANRWIAQFGEEGKRTALVARSESAPFTITRVDVTGTYTPAAMGPGAPAPAPRPGQQLIGFIVEGGARGPLYLRATGPIATMKAQDPAITAMVMSLAVGHSH